MNFIKAETLTPFLYKQHQKFEEVVYEMVKILNHIHNTNRLIQILKLIVIDFVNYKLPRKRYFPKSCFKFSRIKTAAVQKFNLYYGKVFSKS